MSMLSDYKRCVSDPLEEALNNKISKQQAELAKVQEQLRVALEDKDGAYRERNKLVRLLAFIYPSGIKKTNIDGWDDERHWCVYIDLPTGQASWHIHDSEYPMFANILNEYQGEWDGHTTDEKYARIAAIKQIKGK